MELSPAVKEKLDSLVTVDLYDDGQLDLNRLCERLGMPVFNFAFNDPRRSGAILRSQSGWKIAVAEKDSPQRKRFTTAHELGHYISYLAESYSKPLLANEESEIIDSVVVAFRDNASSSAEIEANEIAGTILMPDHDVKRLVEKGRNPEELARHFNVSESAMSVRLRRLGVNIMEDASTTVDSTDPSCQTPSNA